MTAQEFETIEPALTEEALRHLGWYIQRPSWPDLDWDALTREWGPHATAALALHGQPFGFTMHDVDLLRYAEMLDWSDEDAARLSSLINRIVALLPAER